LGFEVTSRSTNEGPAQQHLDGLRDVRVAVVALAIDHSVPHIELLCYPPNTSSGPSRSRNNDIAATRIVLAGSEQRCLLDPDGHRVVLA
jgi:hypothetical protein